MHFKLDAQQPTVLSVGGSLGASSINRMIMHNLDYFEKNNVQLIWQTGKWMYDEACKAVDAAHAEPFVKVHQFINQMDMAYAAADVVISRAGALSISELCTAGKAMILIPSPNVAEDHQTKNATALSKKGAAIVVGDNECATKGITALQSLIAQPEQCAAMQQAASGMAQRDAANRIVDEIEKIIASSSKKEVAK